MPDYLLYERRKNSDRGSLLFRGEPIKAVDGEAAKTKALLKYPKLRRSRLMAVQVPPLITATIVTQEVEGLAPAEMKALLQPKEDADVRQAGV